jgi:hypothetical protein
MLFALRSPTLLQSNIYRAFSRTSNLLSIIAPPLLPSTKRSTVLANVLKHNPTNSLVTSYMDMKNQNQIPDLDTYREMITISDKDNGKLFLHEMIQHGLKPTIEHFRPILKQLSGQRKFFSARNFFYMMIHEYGIEPDAELSQIYEQVIKYNRNATDEPTLPQNASKYQKLRYVRMLCDIGALTKAIKFVEEFGDKDAHSMLVTGLAKSQEVDLANQYFLRMLQNDQLPDQYTSSILAASNADANCKHNVAILYAFLRANDIGVNHHVLIERAFNINSDKRLEITEQEVLTETLDLLAQENGVQALCIVYSDIVKRMTWGDIEALIKVAVQNNRLSDGKRIYEYAIEHNKAEKPFEEIA